MSEHAGDEVYRALQALAGNDYGGNTGALLVVYAVEGFLRRLAASPYAANMTLKGGMLMAATSARRMTKDADLATVGVANDEAAIATAVREIVAVALDDGLAFDAKTIRTELMRERRRVPRRPRQTRGTPVNGKGHNDARLLVRRPAPSRRDRVARTARHRHHPARLVRA